jgi:hypothetical protein
VLRAISFGALFGTGLTVILDAVATGAGLLLSGHAASPHVDVKLLAWACLVTAATRALAEPEAPGEAS